MYIIDPKIVNYDSLQNSKTHQDLYFTLTYKNICIMIHIALICMKFLAFSGRE